MANSDLVNHLKANGALKTPAVIKAFSEVDRAGFVLPEYKYAAYEDRPLPIVSEATISQPTTVAIMTEALEVKSGMKVLEIGSGSGYQAAILSKLVVETGEVITIEFDKEVFGYAKSHLKDYKNINVINADGSRGYKALAPYDRIIITGAMQYVPDELVRQVKVGGVIVAPIGPPGLCELLRVKRSENNTIRTSLGTFSFVPIKTANH